jgi:hypothetical protein
MQSDSQESYFILPVKKQPIGRFPRLQFVKWALVPVVMLAMILSALALGAWWDSLSSGDTYSLQGK